MQHADCPGYEICEICAAYDDGYQRGKDKAFFELFTNDGGDAQVARRKLAAIWCGDIAILVTRLWLKEQEVGRTGLTVDSVESVAGDIGRQPDIIQMIDRDSYAVAISHAAQLTRHFLEGAAMMHREDDYEGA